MRGFWAAASPPACLAELTASTVRHSWFMDRCGDGRHSTSALRCRAIFCLPAPSACSAIECRDFGQPKSRTTFLSQSLRRFPRSLSAAGSTIACEATHFCDMCTQVSLQLDLPCWFKRCAIASASEKPSVPRQHRLREERRQQSADAKKRPQRNLTRGRRPPSRKQHDPVERRQNHTDKTRQPRRRYPEKPRNHRHQLYIAEPQPLAMPQRLVQRANQPRNRRRRTDRQQSPEDKMLRSRQKHISLARKRSRARQPHLTPRIQMNVIRPVRQKNRLHANDEEPTRNPGQRERIRQRMCLPVHNE